MDLLTLGILAFAVSLIAGAVGYTGLSRGSPTLTRILFGVTMIIALILLVLALLEGTAFR